MKKSYSSRLGEGERLQENITKVRMEMETIIEFVSLVLV
jgi:hypothetical protein